MMISPTRGEHAHAAHRTQDRPVGGYRVAYWQVDNGTVTDTLLDVDGDLVSLSVLEASVRQGGRRLEVVPFGWMGCCDLYRK